MSRPLDPGPAEGDPAPDIDLLAPWGKDVPLSFFWQDRPAVVVFLRYFGCPFCQAQVVGLREDRELFQEAGANVVLVGQGSPEEEDAFRRARRVPFPVLLDSNLAAYRGYGLGPGSALQIFGPRVAGPFLRANLHRETLQRGLHGGSFFQMPGTFVVDTAGVVRLAHRNRTVADNPRNETLLHVLSGLMRSPV